MTKMEFSHQIHDSCKSNDESPAATEVSKLLFENARKRQLQLQDHIDTELADYENAVERLKIEYETRIEEERARFVERIRGEKLKFETQLSDLDKLHKNRLEKLVADKEESFEEFVDLATNVILPTNHLSLIRTNEKKSATSSIIENMTNGVLCSAGNDTMLKSVDIRDSRDDILEYLKRDSASGLQKTGAQRSLSDLLLDNPLDACTFTNMMLGLK